MTTDDQGLRAAAERQFAWARRSIGKDGLTADQRAGVEDAYLVAQHVLNSCRADDGEPLDVNWLRSVGFIDYADPDKYRDAYLSLWMDRREHNAAILAVHWARPDNPAGHFWSANGYSLYRKAYPQTRGDVRNLAKCLGIELKEPA